MQIKIFSLNLFISRLIKLPIISKNLYTPLVFFFLLVSVIVISSCAKQASPTGGPKDTIPPVAILFEPQNFTTDFEAKKVKIKFNEFIELKDVRSELVVSPPFENPLEPKIVGKSIVLEFEDELMDSMTYNFNFGNSVVDYHEGNINKDFQYILSTGSVIDSFAVSGTILNSFDLKPSEEPFLIFLYKNTHDSVPQTILPFYIGKSRKEGDFMVNNIQPGTYKVFALKDMNNNLLFDLPNEQIAFLDSVVTLNPLEFENHLIHSHDSLNADSLLSDSIIFADTASVIIKTDTLEFTTTLSDTILTDSLNLITANDTTDTLNITEPELFNLYGIETKLYFFEEKYPSQYLSDNKRENRRSFNLIFNEPHKDSIQLELLDTTVNQWYMEERNKTSDTILYWITDTLLVKKDTIRVHINHEFTDSNNVYVRIDDTLNFIFKEPKSSNRRRSRGDDDEKEKKEMLNISTNVSSKAFDLNRKIILTSDHPVENIDTNKIQLLFHLNDSVYEEVSYLFYADTNRLRHYFIECDWEPEMKYTLIIDSTAISDIYGLHNDSLGKSFTTQSLDYYATLILDMQNVYVPVIIQLMDDKENILHKTKIYTDQKITFNFLEPKNYKVKALYDPNDNNEWDTGNYNEKRQPEKVLFFPKTLEGKSNWEIEEVWKLK